MAPKRKITLLPIPSDYIPTIDGWRAIAVILVILSHVARLFADETRHEFHRAVVILGKGAYGVGLFFSISGFLITTRLISDFRENGRVRFKNFYIKRLGRILPPVFTYLLAVALLNFAASLAVQKEEYLGSLFFIRNYVGKGWVTGHFWSLAIEEQFYLVWPLAFALLYSSRRKFSLLAITLVFAGWRYWVLKTGISPSFLHSSYFSTDICLVGLLWGAWLAIERTDFNWDWLKFRNTNVGFSSLFLICLLSTWAQCPFGEIIFPLAAALVVTATPDLKRSGFIFRFLESRFLKLVGVRSYGIYVWQQLTLARFPKFQTPPSILGWSLRFVLLIVLVEISYRLIEKPILRWARKKAESKDLRTAFARIKKTPQNHQIQTGRR